MRGVVGEGGGAYHAIVGTLIITGLAALISVPIGLMTAIYLVEYGTGRLKKAITFLVDVMTGIPSIVAGLFAYALFAVFFGPGVRMGIGGAVALSVLMIPVVVRSSEEILKLVPNELREAAWRSGCPVADHRQGRAAHRARRARDRRHPGRSPGSSARPLRCSMIVGITNGTNFNPFDGRMATLPVFATTSSPSRASRRSSRSTGPGRRRWSSSSS